MSIVSVTGLNYKNQNLLSGLGYTVFKTIYNKVAIPFMQCDRHIFPVLLCFGANTGLFFFCRGANLGP